MRIAGNIQRLRKDCGWSLDGLADKTGIDKKQVVSHVNGKNEPSPKNKKFYADAFSKALGRPIAASDLEK
jgi:hypothetical protein